MEKTSSIYPTLQDLINTQLQSPLTDSIYKHKFPSIFQSSSRNSSPVRKPKITLTKTARQYLTTKRLSETHYLESKFEPYFKANKFIKKIESCRTPKKNHYDLATEKYKEFTNTDFSLNELVNSNSVLKASRLPMSPVSKSFEKTVEVIKSIHTSPGKLAMKACSPFPRCTTVNFNKTQTKSKGFLKSPLLTKRVIKKHQL